MPIFPIAWDYFGNRLAGLNAGKDCASKSENCTAVAHYALLSTIPSVADSAGTKLGQMSLTKAATPTCTRTNQSRKVLSMDMV
jgi:hypothetical protein